MIITYDAKLVTKTKLNDRAYFLSFTLPGNTDWSYQAGQYMIFHIPTNDTQPKARRLYSIASSPTNKDTLDFIIELVPNGVGSKYIDQLAVNDTVTLQGPAGMFTYKPSKHNVIFLATGTGIAPIYSMIATLLSSKCNPPVSGKSPKFYLFWGMRYEKNLYLTHELAALAKEHNNFQYSICLSRERDINSTRCMRGRVTDGLKNLTSNLKLPASNFDYYLCGSKQVVESLLSFLGENKAPKEQIYFEKFT